MRSKERLTITLAPDLLRQVDRMIDRKVVRNRSHAIELLLRESLEPTVSHAVLLAGGEHQDLPIPALASFGGRALSQLMIRHLAGHGVRRLVILAGRHLDEIETVIGGGADLGVEIRYVDEGRPLGTAGALKRAEPYLDGEPFLVLHADVLTDMDIGAFVGFHFGEGSLATIAVKPRRAELDYGKVMLQGNRITDFIDRGQEKGISIINTGVYLFQPEILEMIEAEKPSRLETDVFPRLAESGELSAFLFQGIWFDVRSAENHETAQARWRSRSAPHPERRPRR